MRLDGWDPKSHPMKKDNFGSFDLVIPSQDGQTAIPHNSKLKAGLSSTAPTSSFPDTLVRSLLFFLAESA